MAFIVWRVAHNMLKRMRGAEFDVDVGAPYFAFMREVLVFLIAVVDRIAYARMDRTARCAFTTALVRHCADTLADNETDLLGPQPDGASYGDSFIDLVNEVTQHYAEFGADPQATASPDRLRARFRLPALPRQPPRADAAAQGPALGDRPGDGQRGARGGRDRAERDAQPAVDRAARQRRTPLSGD